MMLRLVVLNKTKKRKVYNRNKTEDLGERNITNFKAVGIVTAKQENTFTYHDDVAGPPQRSKLIANKHSASDINRLPVSHNLEESRCMWLNASSLKG